MSLMLMIEGSWRTKSILKLVVNCHAEEFKISSLYLKTIKKNIFYHSNPARKGLNFFCNSNNES